MAVGPGKYDQECTLVRETTQAAGVVLIILDGKLGNGFSVQGTPYTLLQLPEILESAAKEIRRSRRSIHGM